MLNSASPRIAACRCVCRCICRCVCRCAVRANYVLTTCNATRCAGSPLLLLFRVCDCCNARSYGNAEMDALFTAIDVDGSGTVELDEMQRLLRKGADIKLAANLQDGAMGEIEVEAKNKYAVRTHAREGDLAAPLRHLASTEELRDALVQGCGRVIDLFRAFDANGDGRVSKAEFRAALPLLGFAASNTSTIDAIFDAIDAASNRDGAIEYDELEKALRRDDIVLAAELQAGAVEFDREAKNAIELRKDGPRDGATGRLRAASVEAISASLRSNLERVTDFFRACDRDANGTVTKEEFREALPLLGFGSGGEGSIDALFDKLDASGDGLIEYSELADKLLSREAKHLMKVQPSGSGGAGTAAGPKITHAPAQGSFGHLF